MNLKYYLHKHIQSVHSIEVDLDEIKMKKDRKNKAKPKQESFCKLIKDSQKKERSENIAAYRSKQKLKQAMVRKTAFRRMRSLWHHLSGYQSVCRVR